MDIKVIRYKNYGCTMEGGEKDEIQQKFYWCFYKLNNNKIIVSQYVENYYNNKIPEIELDFHYTNTYKFDDDFYSWFDTTFQNDERKLGFEQLTKNEEQCVTDFFHKNI